MKIKRKIDDEYILPVMTYGSETWALNNAMMEKLAVAQRKMERMMLGIIFRDRKRNTWIHWCKRHRQRYQDGKAQMGRSHSTAIR